MRDHPGRRLAPWTLTATAVIALVLAATRPAPWLLALGLYATFTLVWWEVFTRHARTGQTITAS